MTPETHTGALQTRTLTPSALAVVHGELVPVWPGDDLDDLSGPAPRGAYGRSKIPSLLDWDEDAAVG